MNAEPTYIFENDKVYAMVEGRVVASATDVDTLDEKLVEGEKEAATHIVTPNGLKGQILGRVQGTWGEQVTVRFENGNIVHLPVDNLKFAAEAKAEETNPLADLETRLASNIIGNRDELFARNKELASLKRTAQEMIGGAHDERLDQIIVQAEFEQAEIGQAIDHLDQQAGEAFAPPAPYDMHVVEQGGPNRGAETWIDKPLNDMIAEAEGTNYEQLMDEGPESFVAELDAPALADGGAVRAMASSWIRSHTAAADPSIREKYEGVWLSRIEDCRRARLAQVKEVQHKEAAATEQLPEAPDTSLFM